MFAAVIRSHKINNFPSSRAQECSDLFGRYRDQNIHGRNIDTDVSLRVYMYPTCILLLIPPVANVCLVGNILCISVVVETSFDKRNSCRGFRRRAASAAAQYRSKEGFQIILSPPSFSQSLIAHSASLFRSPRPICMRLSHEMKSFATSASPRDRWKIGPLPAADE